MFRCLGILIVLMFAWLCTLGAHVILAETGDQETFGAEANSTGDPIGGGKGYRRIVTASQYRVRTKKELLLALKQATSKEVVYVEDGVEIDLTGHRQIVIPAGVVLASGRGHNGSKGALIYTREDKPTPPGKAEGFALLATGGPGVRVTGIRLRGPDTKRRRGYEYINSDGISTTHDNLEVDNCELWGWSHAGVFLRAGTRAHIHHNSIHHCQRSGLGYGVALHTAEALIEANLFDWCRHAIAATGKTPSGYEARYNLVLEHASSHSFDMHGGKDRKDGTNIAGDWMKIHHNTFRAKVIPIVVRGRCTQSCEVHHNWFVAKNTPRDAVRQKNAVGNVHVYRNRFTPSGETL